VYIEVHVTVIKSVSYCVESVDEAYTYILRYTLHLLSLVIKSMVISFHFPKATTSVASVFVRIIMFRCCTFRQRENVFSLMVRLFLNKMVRARNTTLVRVRYKFSTRTSL